MACAVSATTGIVAVRSSLRRRPSVSTPSIPGSCTSISTSAGSCATASSIASSPVAASSVTYPAACRTSRKSFVFFSLSSTIRTRSPAMTALLRLDREREDEAAAVSELALHPDAAAVQLDEAFRERQPKPGALALLQPDVGLLELGEDPLVIFGRDPRPGVRHRHPHLSIDLGR